MHTLTPSQAKFMQEHRERRDRIAAHGKPDTPIICVSASVRSARADIAPVVLLERATPVVQWVERQIHLYQPWFSIIEEIDAPPVIPPSMGKIQHICASYYEVAMTEMLSGRRYIQLVRARQVAMFLCKEFTPRSLPEIGRRFGGRDHTTVIHAVRKIAQNESFDKDLADDLAMLRKLIREACQ